MTDGEAKWVPIYIYIFRFLFCLFFCVTIFVNVTFNIVETLIGSLASCTVEKKSRGKIDVPNVYPKKRHIKNAKNFFTSFSPIKLNGLNVCCRYIQPYLSE